MYYKNLFDKKKKNGDSLLFFLLVMAIISLIIGMFALCIFLVALRNNGFSFALKGNLDLGSTAHVATVASGIIGTLLSFSSILFMLLTIRLQQKEIHDFRISQKENATLDLFFKSLDCINIKIINKEIESLVCSEFGKFSLACLGVHLEEVKQTLELAIQVLPLADKMRYVKEPLNLKRMETAKSIYDNSNCDSKKIELLYETSSLNNTICNALCLMDSLSEENQKSCFFVLKSKLGIYGNMLLLTFIFLNQISWTVFRFYTLNDVFELYHYAQPSVDENYNAKVTELIKQYRNVPIPK